MRKNLKILITGLLSISLILCTPMTIKSVNADNDLYAKLKEQENFYLNPDNVIRELGQDIYNEMMNQAQALEAYNYLLENALQDTKGNATFPEDYAGEYIEDGKLIILSNNKEKNSSYIQLLKDFDVVEVKNVDLSYKDLMNVADEFIKKSSLDNINYYIEPQKNKLVFGVEKANKSKIVEAYNNYNAVSILSSSEKKKVQVEFEEIKVVTPTVNLYGGQKITNLSKQFTLGFCGYSDGVPAILTCGHGRTKDENIYYGSTSTQIGAISKVQFTDGQSGDYSIAKITNASYTTTNNVTSGTSLYGIMGTMSAPVGTLVYRYGQMSGLEALKISKTGLSITYSTYGVTLKSMYAATHVSGNGNIGGDSGGPIYTTNSSGNWCAVGTTSGVLGTVTSADYEVYISPIGLVSGFSVRTN